MSILEMRNISKSFSGALVNDSICLSVEKGHIHALLGENGAGKTTLMNILFGIYTADDGQVIWKGRQVHFDSPMEAIASGIGMVHQHFSLVRKMTVLDNIILGLKHSALFIPRARLRVEIRNLAEKYNLSVSLDSRISDLSVGEQQRVEILKALYKKAELLILDEPTGVLTPEETEHFFDVLRKLKKEGYAVIIITHRMSEVMEISDMVTVIRDGKVIVTKKTSETSPDELSYYMIGRETAKSYDMMPKKESDEILMLQNVTLKKHRRKESLKDITLTVYEGEVLGIAGVDGNGQKELAQVIAGITRHTAGDIIYKGKNINRSKVRDRFDSGISYIPDDRHADGLVLEMNIMDNLMLREFRKKPYSNKFVLNRKVIACEARKSMEEYRIKASGQSREETPVKLMSGGNQQKVIVAREVSGSTELVIANQPTRGLDIGATEFVRTALLNKRNDNKSVILISADLEEILAVSDRIAVMFEGKIMGVLRREEADVKKIGLLMGGIAEVENE